MQATTRAKQVQFGRGQVPVVLVVLAVVVTLAVAAAVTSIARHDETHGVASLMTQAQARNARLQEINILPDARVISMKTQRMLEINALPEAAVQPVDWATIHFAEINALPEAAVAPLTNVQIRFLEMNQLPGDKLVAPEVIPGAPS